MNRAKAIIAAITIALPIGACAEQTGPKQTIGTLGGAAAGGLLGAQIGSGTGQLAATAAGVLIGALVGSEIGRTMDDVDKQKAQGAYTQATEAPIGKTITWSNPETGHSGTVTPTREGKAATGEYCREFQQTVTIGGKTEDAYGTACRQPDGTWKIAQ